MDNDITPTLQAKSDQLNAADLIGSPATVKILGVSINKGSEQPISIKVDGGYQTYKPCKSMRRLMASLWGLDSSKWVGHSITIYCDIEVIWAGKAVGGIRISHATGIDKQTEITTRASKTKVITYTVMPLNIIAPSSDDKEVENENETIDLPETISTDEQKELVEIAKKSGWPEKELMGLLKGYGFKKRNDVTKEKFKVICDTMENPPFEEEAEQEEII